MITILYATMTGNAQTCAEDIATILTQHDLPSKVRDLADYPAAELANEDTVLLAVSTWGEGDPPDDAIPFADDLAEVEAGSLPNLRYAVFALGDTAYDEFCGFGFKCDQHLERSGATRLLDCENCDLDQDERLPAWAKRLIPLLAGQPVEAAA
jgi:sulfite reductase (NADPH) flavoprotein alpha-component